MKKYRIIKKYRIYLYCGSAMLISEIWKQWCLTWMIGDGRYNWWHFPFQLCSIPMYVCLLIPFVKSEKVRGNLFHFLMDFGLLAGIFTFFDTTGLHYPYFPLTIHSYVWHIVLIILGLYTGFRGKEEKTNSPFTGSAFIYLSCCLFATIFNLVLYKNGPINMFYISPHYLMTQKVFCYITEYFGNTAGILSYIASTVLGAWIIHCLWRHYDAIRQ